MAQETALAVPGSSEVVAADQPEEPYWFAPWKCGLCETRNEMERGHNQHFCNTCGRDRTVEFKWVYSFKESAIHLKKYKPFVEPPVSWKTAAADAAAAANW